MEICELENKDEMNWDKYVLNHQGSTFYHLIGWKNVVEKSYGHKSYYLMVKEDKEIKGIFPIFLMKSLLFGKKTVSVPFAPYGGPIGDNRTIEESLIERGVDITNKNNVDYMELRNNISRDSKLVTNTNYMTIILKLDANPDLVWKGFNNKLRNAVRKSLKSDLEMSNGSVEDFYNLYSKNMRDLGTPTHNKEFFSAIISEFRDKAYILTVRHNGKSVSAAILLYFKDTVISGWAASDRKYKDLNPNNLLYWSAIKMACEKGYKFFDFGRSIEGSGTYRFKKPWGAEENHLQYEYYLNTIKHMPDTSQANANRKLFAWIWQTLPLSLTNAIGPKLRGSLP
jgi:FemAB-related protein (PEP-CTERM system-associated)